MYVNDKGHYWPTKLFINNVLWLNLILPNPWHHVKVAIMCGTKNPGWCEGGHVSIKMECKEEYVKVHTNLRFAVFRKHSLRLQKLKRGFPPIKIFARWHRGPDSISKISSSADISVEQSVYREACRDFVWQEVKFTNSISISKDYCRNAVKMAIK